MFIADDVEVVVKPRLEDGLTQFARMASRHFQALVPPMIDDPTYNLPCLIQSNINGRMRDDNWSVRGGQARIRPAACWRRRRRRSLFAVSQRCIDAVGLFDENIYPAMWEDADWMVRLKLLGEKQRVDPYFHFRHMVRLSAAADAAAAGHACLLHACMPGSLAHCMVPVQASGHGTSKFFKCNKVAVAVAACPALLDLAALLLRCRG